MSMLNLGKVWAVSV